MILEVPSNLVFYDYVILEVVVKKRIRKSSLLVFLFHKALDGTVIYVTNHVSNTIFMNTFSYCGKCSVLNTSYRTFIP